MAKPNLPRGGDHQLQAVDQGIQIAAVEVSTPHGVDPGAEILEHRIAEQGPLQQGIVRLVAPGALGVGQLLVVTDGLVQVPGEHPPAAVAVDVVIDVVVVVVGAAVLDQDVHRQAAEDLLVVEVVLGPGEVGDVRRVVEAPDDGHVDGSVVEEGFEEEHQVITQAHDLVR